MVKVEVYGYQYNIVDKILNPIIVGWIANPKISVIEIDRNNTFYRGRPVYKINTTHLVCNCTLKAVGLYFKEFYKMTSVYIESFETGLVRLYIKNKVPKMFIVGEKNPLSKGTLYDFKCRLEKHKELNDIITQLEIRDRLRIN